MLDCTCSQHKDDNCGIYNLFFKTDTWKTKHVTGAEHSDGSDDNLWFNEQTPEHVNGGLWNQQCKISGLCYQF